MKGTQSCTWLSIGTTTTCSRRCVYSCCKVHRAQLRRGAILPQACRRCGVGTQSEARLCERCGGSSLRRKLHRIEKRAHKRFRNVMCEIISPIKEKVRILIPTDSPNESIPIKEKAHISIPARIGEQFPIREKDRIHIPADLSHR